MTTEKRDNQKEDKTGGKRKEDAPENEPNSSSTEKMESMEEKKVDVQSEWQRVKEVLGRHLIIANVMNRNASLRLINVYAAVVKSEHLAIFQQLPLLLATPQLVILVGDINCIIDTTGKSGQADSTTGLSACASEEHSITLLVVPCKWWTGYEESGGELLAAVFLASDLLLQPLCLC
eukprot:g41491.t1